MFTNKELEARRIAAKKFLRGDDIAADDLAIDVLELVTEIRRLRAVAAIMSQEPPSGSSETLGEKLRDDGCARVLASEQSVWRSGYTSAVVGFLARKRAGESFLGEELRYFLEPIIGRPRHPNSWGAMSRKVLNDWLDAGFIRTNGMSKSSRPSNHAGLYPVYIVEE